MTPMEQILTGVVVVQLIGMAWLHAKVNHVHKVTHMNGEIIKGMGMAVLKLQGHDPEAMFQQWLKERENA